MLVLNRGKHTNPINEKNVMSYYRRKRVGAPAIYKRIGHVAAGHVPLPISPL
jgi:hypothetical protein